ncbi:MAG TPA: YgiT-type zinc finger protein [Candidatus Nanoarchaeia archaeon]|nr:YgiT-type zinc finger protein [Candidatus Nanoarchaeia archaeon]
MKCPVCEKGMLVKVDDIVNDVDGYLFVVRGLRCSECGDEIIDEMEGQRFIKIARRLGVWGEPLKLHRKLSQSGRGTILRIPNDISDELKLKGNEEVTIAKVGKKKIIIEIE